ncbi:tRNA preQ1(34) S-adenosylmethionine ribosyltransferase-isomerase QueA [Anoxynatronum sibiricum]|uniref:S-adenosylmethionine:tRNA ribosyltransferase-isomerase n=1 Tax=Anoxynatronum sibiricum TaxID=210623 RepID=A0ABU9VPX3_9CLOT
MKTNEFNYELPEHLIAQHPLEKRDQSRLLALNANDGTIRHYHFPDIRHLLKPGDGLVINNSRVIPARLIGRKRYTNGRAEFLLLKQTLLNHWEVLAKPAKRIKAGTEVIFGKNDLRAIVREEKDEGLRIIEFITERPVFEVLEELGEMPLPPYIHEHLDDRERYQTVYSRHKGSAAAPTAGLHFTKELIEEIESMGVIIIPVTLHVGLGTFRPVQAEDIEAHEMHEEYYEITEESADAMNRIKSSGGRIVAVGTTSCRTLESAMCNGGSFIEAGSDWTRLFITPGYQFRWVDVLITNFHLPESTLLMLVSAFAGKDLVMESYRQAVDASYRFFSFGDAMWIER